MLRIVVVGLGITLCTAAAATASTGAGVGRATRPYAAPSPAPAAPAVPPPVPAPRADTAYTPPVAPLSVVHPFDPPTTPFGPGHLGADLATTLGQPVRAAAAGVVSFAGSVAGRGLVVIQHPDGIRTEYEPLVPDVAAGTAVRGGQVVGRLRGRHGTCAAGRCLHWGARRGDTYLDPLLLLQPLGPVRLLPWTGVTAWTG
jgi:murein DD-endopeptidase MepM/ murein hydrolase activator NlpD